MPVPDEIIDLELLNQSCNSIFWGEVNEPIRNLEGKENFWTEKLHDGRELQADFAARFDK